MDECAAFLAYMVDYMQSGHSVEGVSGRILDLKHAYKQYGISSQDREVIRLEVRKSDSGQVSLFGVNSLPFGASGSVGGFLRVSLTIGFLGLSISSWYGRPSLAIRQFSLGTP